MPPLLFAGCRCHGDGALIERLRWARVPGTSQLTDAPVPIGAEAIAKHGAPAEIAQQLSDLNCTRTYACQHGAFDKERGEEVSL